MGSARARSEKSHIEREGMQRQGCRRREGKGLKGERQDSGQGRAPRTLGPWVSTTGLRNTQSSLLPMRSESLGRPHYYFQH